MTNQFRAALFDWRGTLFHDEDDSEWVRASAASIGRVLSVEQATALTGMLGATSEHPEVVAARPSADCSVELHRAATLLELDLAGFDDELAIAICERDGDISASVPYPDTARVLRDLKSRGVRIGVVSDILPPVPNFAERGLDVVLRLFPSAPESPTS